MARSSTGGAPGWRELRAHRIARQAQERQERQQLRDEDDYEEEEEERPKPKKRKAKAPARSGKVGASAPRIGFLRASSIERAFILLIYAGVAALVVLSIVGTFYGSHGTPAPITQPGVIWDTFWAAGGQAWIAIGMQIALSLTQYGSRQLARHDWRWWLLYLAALGISVYFNIQAYYTPLLAYMLPGYIYLLILAFDVFPEFVSLRHD